MLKWALAFLGVARVIESTDHAFAVVDAYAVSAGHTLVITRRHVTSPFEPTMQEMSEIRQMVASARTRLDQSLRPSGYNLGLTVGGDANQTFIHGYVHLIFRYPGDTVDPSGGVRNVIPGRGRYR